MFSGSFFIGIQKRYLLCIDFRFRFIYPGTLYGKVNNYKNTQQSREPRNEAPSRQVIARGHHHHASETPFQWRFAGGTIMVRLYRYQLKKRSQRWIPSEKTFRIRAWCSGSALLFLIVSILDLCFPSAFIYKQE